MQLVRIKSLEISQCIWMEGICCQVVVYTRSSAFTQARYSGSRPEHCERAITKSKLLTTKRRIHKVFAGAMLSCHSLRSPPDYPMIHPRKSSIWELVDAMYVIIYLQCIRHLVVKYKALPCQILMFTSSPVWYGPGCGTQEYMYR